MQEIVDKTLMKQRKEQIEFPMTTDVKLIAKGFDWSFCRFPLSMRPLSGMSRGVIQLGYLAALFAFKPTFLPTK